MIAPVNQNNFSKVLELLKENNLPVDDISDVTTLFAITENSKVVATVGIEFYGKSALLRSLAVVEEKRNKTLGKELVSFIEKHAREHGAKEIFLLTTTAARYFSKKNYEKVERDNVPDEIRKSTEFKSTCPSSAVIMKKKLG